MNCHSWPQTLRSVTLVLGGGADEVDRPYDKGWRPVNCRIPCLICYKSPSGKIGGSIATTTTLAGISGVSTTTGSIFHNTVLHLERKAIKYQWTTA